MAISVEHAISRQLPPREAFAQLLGHAGAGLEGRSNSRSGYLLDHDPGQRGEFAPKKPTMDENEVDTARGTRADDSRLAALAFAAVRSAADHTVRTTLLDRSTARLEPTQPPRPRAMIKTVLEGTQPI
jgi:hypothetical protein